MNTRKLASEEKPAKCFLIPVIALACACSSQQQTKNSPDTETVADTETISDTSQSIDTVSNTESGPGEGQWEWEDLAADLGDYVGTKLVGVGGTAVDDIVVGGMIFDICVLGFNGNHWNGISVDGCQPYTQIAKICSAKGHDTLWAAPWYGFGWSILRRQEGEWALTPQPAWWLESYDTGYSEDRIITCLENGAVAALVHDISASLAWLTIFDGAVWEVKRQFDFQADGLPYSVFGTSTGNLVIFIQPSQLGGVRFDGTQFTTISIPEFGVPGTIENDHGVRGIAGDEEFGYYAVGYWHKSPDLCQSGFVWRSNDLQTWEEMEDVPHVDSTVFGEGFWDVCVNDQGDVYVVGDRRDVASTADGENEPLVLRYDGAEWFDVEIPPVPDAEQPGWERLGGLNGVWCHGGHVFAVGQIAPKGIGEPGVLHYTPPEDL